MILGLVTEKNGFPLYAKVMPGNTSEKVSIREVVKYLRGELGLESGVIMRYLHINLS
jgi:transposase